MFRVYLMVVLGSLLVLLTAVVFSSAKWFWAPGVARVMSWQIRQSRVPAVEWVPQAWRPMASLYWEGVVP